MTDGADVSDVLDQLRTELGYWDGLFCESIGDPEVQQIPLVSAVSVVARHLRRLPGFKGSLTALDALTAALEAVSIGNKHPLLASSGNKAGARVLTFAQESLKARAAAFVEILMECGHKEAAAVEAVVEILNAHGVKGFRRNGEITRATVRAWRTDLNAGDDFCLEDIAEDTKITFREHAEKLGREWPLAKNEAARAVAAVLGKQADRYVIHSGQSAD